MITNETVQAFLQHCQKAVPGFGYKLKNGNRLMQWLGNIVSPFNPTFMTNFTTTIGKTVYFARDPVLDPVGTFWTLTHEFVHAYDAKRNPFFGFLYLFPLTLMPVLWALHVGLTRHWAAALLLGAIALYAGLGLLGSKVVRYVALPLAGLAVVAGVTVGFLYTKWWGFLLLGSLVFVAPLPAPFRAWAELRGYAMSLCIRKWLYPEFVPEKTIEMYTKEFTGAAYFFMLPFKNYVTKRLLALYQQGQTATPPPGFEIVRDFVKNVTT